VSLQEGTTDPSLFYEAYFKYSLLVVTVEAENSVQCASVRG